MVGRRCDCQWTGKVVLVLDSVFLGVRDSYMYYLEEAGGILDQADWLLTSGWDGKVLEHGFM
jgi:hypothetical protein